ncbi:hypothetical protein J2I47_20580 [Fibrella sp. HMF5335]|uniref:Uncharacterized protein n=1 Tax=Fibrella rubiginis TaxID=2817060 RepID=A0A939GLI9_9BACT|nr:hypothetical protein [Fibrella rubiginis]MBO0938961.1 hypothetical protein [Fibrella rubiginis]
MNRTMFITLVSLYGILIVLGMLIAPQAMLQVYGIPALDKFHIALFQLMGMPILGLNVIGLLIRNAETGQGVRAYMTGQAVNLIGFSLLSIYHVIVHGIPSSTFFVVDTGWRVVLGLGMVYYLMRLKPVANLA